MEMNQHLKAEWSKLKIESYYEAKYFYDELKYLLFSLFIGFIFSGIINLILAETLKNRYMWIYFICTLIIFELFFCLIFLQRVIFGKRKHYYYYDQEKDQLIYQVNDENLINCGKLTKFQLSLSEPKKYTHLMLLKYINKYDSMKRRKDPELIITYVFYNLSSDDKYITNRTELIDVWEECFNRQLVIVQDYDIPKKFQYLGPQ